MSAAGLDEERAQARRLGLCDVSALPRLVVKGRGAAAWVGLQGAPVPQKTYAAAEWGDAGQVIRTGNEEVFLEDGPRGDRLPPIVRALRAAEQTEQGEDCVFAIARQDASFFLTGARAHEVLAQTCGVDLRRPDARLVYSRVAGVSAGIRHRPQAGTPLYQLWVDPSYGHYLWQTLLAIVTDLDGRPVGTRCFWPHAG